MKPQCQQLLEALQQGPLTTKQIRDRLGIGMPATRVYELRHAGHPIARETVTVRNRHGKPCRVARYRLADAEPTTRAQAA